MFIAKWHNLKCSDSQHSRDAQTSLVLFIYLLYFWLHRVLIAVCGLSLFAESGGYSLIVVRGLLMARTSLVVQHTL